jgi:hypothetical protein
MMLMMQTMGDSPISMDAVLPMMLMMDDDSDMDSILMMVMLGSMTGGMNSQHGFDNNFNMLLPLLLMDSDDGSDDSSMDLLVLMMAMQSQAPNSAFGTGMMLPLLLMDDDGDNETLMFFMMMNQGKTKCEPEVVYAQEPVRTTRPLIIEQPEPIVYRTGRSAAFGTQK